VRLHIFLPEAMAFFRRYPLQRIATVGDYERNRALSETVGYLFTSDVPYLHHRDHAVGVP
jgi:hypothetical protein